MLAESAQLLIYAGQPWWLGPDMALHSPISCMHSVKAVGQPRLPTSQLPIREQIRYAFHCQGGRRQHVVACSKQDCSHIDKKSRLKGMDLVNST